jgi:heptosyltransferase-3
MQTAAVLPALGIGDALLMMIASHQLTLEGCHVTTFHSSLSELQTWFPGHHLQPLPPEDKLLETLASFDLILVENDNSPKIHQLIQAFRPTLSIFYPTYSATKHAPLTSRDRTFHSHLPMASNIAEAIASLINRSALSKQNGISPPPHLVHRLHSQRVVLHPTSRQRNKNWTASGFLAVARVLIQRGYDPVFCVGPEEYLEWEPIQQEGFKLARLPTLADLATFIYESGFVIGNDSLIGHLASNLCIPTLTIANDPKRMRLWRPDWLAGQLVLPPPYLPNWKFLRLRENSWQLFISPRKVLKSFDQLLAR